MPKSRFHKLLLKLWGFFRMVMLAWMVGIANGIQQEGKFMDDTHIKTEIKEGLEDDDPFLD